jgi:hypothetical protein
MDLVEVDVVGAEPLKAAIDCLEDVFAREAAVVGIVAHRIVELGRDDGLVAGHPLLQGLADDLLARAARIHVRDVESIDAEIERLAKERAALALVENPFAPGGIAESHAAQNEA